MCTAGRCRSPVAAALLAKRLEFFDSDISVDSVGLRYTGEPIPEVGLALMSQRGIDLAEHRSSGVTAKSIADADLILGMTREHVREIVGISPDAWSKTFTLKDFVRRTQAIAPPRRHQRFADWLGLVGAGRTPQDVLGSSPDDEVSDPFGQRTKVWDRVIEDLDDLISQLPAILGAKGMRSASNRTKSA